VALNSAQSFATRFSDLDRRFGAIARDLNGAIEASVKQINSLSSAIADINDQIMRGLGATSGEAPNDLIDQRDRLVQNLSELTGVTTIAQENGALNVFIGAGQAVVTDLTSIPLVTVPGKLDGTRLEVATTGGGAVSVVSQSITNGELGAALDFRDDVLDPARNSIGRLAATLAVTFNEQHREGFDLNDNFGRDFFSIGTPNVSADPTNTGSITVALDTADIGSLTTADYRLTHDGTDFTLLNLAENTAQTLSGAGPFSVDGLTITVTGAPAAGDVYVVQPTKSIARNMSVAVTDPRELALARPNRTSVAAANIGSGEISPPTVLDVADANLLTTTQLVFNDPPTTYQVNGAGPLIAYTGGTNIDINGWRVQVSGSPEAGDTFTVAANLGGAGDNGNGLMLTELQLAKILDGASTTYQESYSKLVGRVGSKTQELQLSRDAMRVLRENAKASRDSLSAVNLDEEAAQLLRFQQAYSAAAEVISIANDTFSSLLAAVRR
jgi:flagellar hook-associated protein 1 FlgK